MIEKKRELNYWAEDMMGKRASRSSVEGSMGLAESIWFMGHLSESGWVESVKPFTVHILQLIIHSHSLICGEMISGGRSSWRSKQNQFKCFQNNNPSVAIVVVSRKMHDFITLCKSWYHRDHHQQQHDMLIKKWNSQAAFTARFMLHTMLFNG